MFFLTCSWLTPPHHLLVGLLRETEDGQEEVVGICQVRLQHVGYFLFVEERRVCRHGDGKASRFDVAYHIPYPRMQQGLAVQVEMDAFHPMSAASSMMRRNKPKSM